MLRAGFGGRPVPPERGESRAVCVKRRSEATSGHVACFDDSRARLFRPAPAEGDGLTNEEITLLRREEQGEECVFSALR